jgi:MscS family membrane protein
MLVFRVIAVSVGFRLLALTFLVLSVIAQAASSDPTTAVSANPLRPPNTASPRDTLRSFQQNAHDTARRLLDRASPASVDRAALRTLSCLDLRALPPAEYIDQGWELAVLLMEVLDRIALPPIDEAPDLATVNATGLESWTIPNTELTIARTTDGPHAGRFQFTADTVAQLREFYQLSKHLPGKPGGMAGFYEKWSQSPGPWLPSAWTKNLPKFAYIVIFHQALWQWLAALATFGLMLAALLLAYRFARHLDHRGGGRFGPQWYLARVIVTIGAIPLLRLLSDFFDDGINITGARLFVLDIVLRVCLVAAVGWLIVLSLNAVGELVIRFRAFRPGSIDTHLVRIVVRMLAIVALLYLAIYVADWYGVPAAPMIASLGVGGLAIALAVRPTLENVISGLTLFADKPVRVGDFCRYGNDIGTVEQIGLRSTRIRSLERSIVSIPNTEFSQLQLDNFSLRDLRLFKTVLQLHYGTTPEQMRYLLTKLRQLLIGHPMVTPDPARVRFVDFSTHSKNVEIFAYLRCSDENTFLAIKEDILLRIEDIVKEVGTGFAFPSQTLYLARDAGLDAERGRAAEAEVEKWRSSGKLPFPDFDDDERGRLQDVLDFPPKGSARYGPNSC